MSTVSSAVAALAEVMAGRRTLAVTGAGISTDSGIPDYRGVGTTPIEPVDFQQFTADPVWYRWVWARNQATWRLLEGLSPTPGHLALARLEEAGLLSGVATQNVDRLHSRGSRPPTPASRARATPPASPSPPRPTGPPPRPATSGP